MKKKTLVLVIIIAQGIFSEKSLKMSGACDAVIGTTCNVSIDHEIIHA